MDDKAEHSVKVLIQKNKDYRVVYAVGAIGGPTPQGHLACNFYIEYSGLPTEGRFLRNPDGTGRYEDTSEHVLVREIECAVIVTPEVAESIGRWLIDRAHEIKNLRRAKDE
jgi:hypothetical protein